MSSGSKTLRFYVNTKRVSTAVRATDGYILQVYPMHQRFADEEDWKSFWEQHTVSRPILRAEGMMSLESTKTEKSKDPKFRCPECLLDGSIDHRNCIVLKYKGDVQAWENAAFQQENSSSNAARQALPKKVKSWICPACNLGPGNDHRMCICRAFNYSVDAWEEACGIRQ